MSTILFEPEPTCARFMQSNLFGRILAGPIGSAKTTTAMFEWVRRASEQEPGEDGIRYSRGVLLRQTLRAAKDTVLKELQNWLSPIGEWKVSDSTFKLNFNDVRSELLFIPMEDSEEQARILSMQLTFAWLSELTEMDISILGPVSGRLGRYPSGPQGSPTWYGMFGDTNMPVEMTPWHNFFENPPANWEIFIQPGGMEPNAENLNWLLQTAETKKLPLNHPARLARGRKYYEDILQTYGEDSDYVKRYVHAQYGDDPSGLAVFQKSFHADVHCQDETQIVPGYPLIIGQDFGRDPWSVICQPDHLGRLVIHEEVPAENVGLEKHIQMALRPRLLQEKYLGLRIAIVGDPAGVAKSTMSEETSFDLIKRMGFAAFPAPTNDLEPRLRAVEALLLRRDGLIINSTRCPYLVRALAGGYRFSKTKQVGGAIKPKPDKGPFSHVADALQYAALAAHGGMLPYISANIVPRPRNRKPRPTAQGWT